jgi:hypothetical protein
MAAMNTMKKRFLPKHTEEGICNISNFCTCLKSGNEHDIIYDQKGLNGKERKKMKDFIKTIQINEKQWTISG